MCNKYMYNLLPGSVSMITSRFFKLSKAMVILTNHIEAVETGIDISKRCLFKYLPGSVIS